MREPEDGRWSELLAADVERNIGLPLELMSAEGYARREGMTREQYIIKILRAERERRQAEDTAASDNVMLDDLIDQARAAGAPVIEFLLGGAWHSVAPRRTWDLSPDFLAKLLTRYEERFGTKA